MGVIKNLSWTFAALFLFMAPDLGARRVKYPTNPFELSDPLIGQKAPPLEILEWVNGPEVSLDQLKGKVVVLEFFQMWCPGCKRFSIPLMKEWARKYEYNDKITFISVHTVFEGHSLQGLSQLKKFVKKNDIHHRVGVDRHEFGELVPITMKRYQTRGTPAMAIVDKKGIIRFKYFGGFKIEPVEDLLDSLLDE